MQPAVRIQWWELGFVATVVIVFVVRCLLQETQAAEELMNQALRGGVSRELIDRSLAIYQQQRAIVLPVIGGAALLFVAWGSLHYLALPRLNAPKPLLGGFFYLALSVTLLTAGVWVYHYFRLYLRLQHSGDGKIIGLLAYSLYRKKTVFADAVAAGILLALYELLTHLYRYLRRKLPLATSSILRYGHYGLLLGTVGAVFALTWTGQLPSALWNSQTGPWLLLLGLGIQVYGLYRLAYPGLIAFRTAPQSVRWLGYLGLWIGLGLAGSALLWVAYSHDSRLALRPLGGFFFLSAAAATTVVALRHVVAGEKIQLQAQASHSAAELSSLRAQIHPHFLFNALNSLYSTALQGDSEKTAEGIQQLGDMMRFLLEENNLDRILLHKEVEYLHSYIQLQRLRLDETQGIDIRVNIQTPSQDVYLAPMLLTPFVENAFNHGISFQLPSWIYVTLTLDSTKLYFKVHNSLHPRASNEPAAHTSRVGLDNVRKRLELLYPNRHQLDIQRSDQDYFVALTLHLW